MFFVDNIKAPFRPFRAFSGAGGETKKTSQREGGFDIVPYAGITQIRFKGCNLRPLTLVCNHPCLFF
jgi:hypothetical protein